MYLKIKARQADIHVINIFQSLNLCPLWIFSATQINAVCRALEGEWWRRQGLITKHMPRVPVSWRPRPSGLPSTSFCCQVPAPPAEPTGAPTVDTGDPPVMGQAGVQRLAE